MDESTLAVLRTVNELQFKGMPDPRTHDLIYFNPVPLIGIAAYWWGLKPGIDVNQELSLLTTMELVDRYTYPGVQTGEYLRLDEKRVRLTLNENDMYAAYVDDSPVAFELVQTPLSDPWEYGPGHEAEFYAMTKGGVDLLTGGGAGNQFAKLPGEGKRDGDTLPGRQGGETASHAPEEIVEWRRAWRWTCSTIAAAYRVTIEAACSALFEKLSGK